LSPINASIIKLAFATPPTNTNITPNNNNNEEPPTTTSAIDSPFALKGLIRYRGRVAYDGNGFKGFQLQPKRRTVQGALEEVLTQRFQRLVRVVGASRTDSGVHARGQAIHFDLQPEELSNDDDDGIDKLQRSMNSMLRQDVRVYNLEKAPILTRAAYNDKPPMRIPWNAIHDSTGKLYVYRISAAKHMDPIERHTRYDLKWSKEIDVDVFNRTLQHFVGYHDFRAFAGGIEQIEKHLNGETMNTNRTVYSVTMMMEEEDNNLYRIEVRLKGALYKMIRNMIGTALEVAWGNLSEEDFLSLLHRTGAQGRKQNKSKPAPPEGLTLEYVEYDDY
jgi:tRNA pseudouridine38-40 synthase